MVSDTIFFGGVSKGAGAVRLDGRDTLLEDPGRMQMAVYAEVW